MTNTMTVRRKALPAACSRTARRRIRRRKIILNTVLEGLTTIGLGVCFILCAVMVLCVA